METVMAGGRDEWKGGAEGMVGGEGRDPARFCNATNQNQVYTGGGSSNRYVPELELYSVHKPRGSLSIPKVQRAWD